MTSTHDTAPIAAQIEALAPCPFCGGTDPRLEEEGERFFIACQSVECFCALGEGYDRDATSDHCFPTAEHAIAAWNTRPAIVAALGQGEAAPGVVEADIETAARAMCDRVNGVGDYDDNVSQRRSGWMAQAKAGIEAFLARQHGAREPWRLIESAPKDGTWIITAGGGADFGMPMKWCDRVGAWECDAVMLEDWDNQADGYSRPTHWMPLPTAPATDVGEV